MRLWCSFTLLLVIFAASAQASPYARFPALNSDGSRLAFSYQGDLWTMELPTGRAVRLTVHEGYDGYPHWTRNDSAIVFSSNRYGNFDVFLIPSEGGPPQRLTYHSADDMVWDVTPEGEFLFTTVRAFRQVERDLEIFTVPSSGGTPRRICDALGTHPSISPSGRFVAFARGGGSWDRAAYRGPGNLEIWIHDRAQGTYHQLTTFDGNDFMPRWAPGDTLYFLSSRSGSYNVYRMPINGEGKAGGVTEQVTRFDDDGVRWFSLSGDGTAMALERQTNLYIQNLAGGDSPEQIAVSIGADDRLDPAEHRTYTDHVSEFAVSPGGTLTAFVVRGEVFVKENNPDRSRTVNLTGHPFRDWQVDWLNDSTLIFVSDRDGQNELYLLRSADPAEPSLLKSLKHEAVRLTNTPEDESFPVVSPNGTRVAYEIGQGKLVVEDIDTRGVLSNRTVLVDTWDSPGTVRWSPDGQWVAYSLTDLDFNTEVYIQPVDNSRPAVNVSMHPRGDQTPVWTPDGRKLAFLSERNNRDVDIWFAWLRREDWEKTKEEWKEAGNGDEENDSKGKAAEKPPEVKIDVEDIHLRLVQVTSLPGDESSPVISRDGETFYFTAGTPTAKGRDLYSVQWDGSKVEALTTGGQNPSDVRADGSGKHLYYTKSGKLSRYAFKEKKVQTLPFSASIDIVFGREREQIFDDAWRALKRGYYDPNFHGHDWEALRSKYKPWCMEATTQRDFQDMFNLMLAEVNSSHMGFREAEDRIETQEVKTGLLGIEPEPVTGGVRVARVIPGTPAARLASRLQVGDLITAVQGAPVRADTSVYALLANTVNTEILLQVTSAEGKSREVAIRPTGSLAGPLYEEWVALRKQIVDSLSGGRLGYLHIRGMGWANFEQFERELTARGLGKDGIVIDVRYNGGGWISDYLMTVLGYRQYAYTIPRGAARDLESQRREFRGHYPLGERLPYAAWLKPSIALCNRNSYSNAEIFSHGYKNLGIGTLVGTGTYGAVISTGSYSLLDGSTVRMPGRGWFVLSTDLNMELNPAIPDILVDESPDAKARGRDEQLERAVEELLKQLKR
jgi:tricorn protease